MTYPLVNTFSSEVFPHAPSPLYAITVSFNSYRFDTCATVRRRDGMRLQQDEFALDCF